MITIVLQAGLTRLDFWTTVSGSSAEWEGPQALCSILILKSDNRSKSTTLHAVSQRTTT